MLTTHVIHVAIYMSSYVMHECARILRYLITYRAGSRCVNLVVVYLLPIVGDPSFSG